MDDRFLRQQAVVNAIDLNRLRITLIGLGSIGSVTGLYLAKMGIVELRVFDADIVESQNWSNQLYSHEDFGISKVDAFSALMEYYGGYLPNTSCTRYVDRPLTEVVISAVDSMESRKVIWKSVREKPEVRLYIDARMGLETLVVHAVRPQIKDDRVLYAGSLCSDAEALQEPCTARSICYTPLMAASIVCNLVKRYVNQESIPSRIILDLTTMTLLVNER